MLSDRISSSCKLAIFLFPSSFPYPFISLFLASFISSLAAEILPPDSLPNSQSEWFSAILYADIAYDRCRTKSPDNCFRQLTDFQKIINLSTFARNQAQFLHIVANYVYYWLEHFCFNQIIFQQSNWIKSDCTFSIYHSTELDISKIHKSIKICSESNPIFYTVLSIISLIYNINFI